MYVNLFMIGIVSVICGYDVIVLLCRFDVHVSPDPGVAVTDAQARVALLYDGMVDLREGDGALVDASIWPVGLPSGAEPDSMAWMIAWPGTAGDDRIAIVNERGRSDEWIATWLSTPHEAMPDLALSREDIAALVAYLASLRQGQ